MYKLLMSINPEHVDNILDGTKRYEYRKKRCRESIDSIVIYSTSPVMQIVAEVEVIDIIEGSPQTVWKLTSNAAGIDKTFYDHYYKGKETAVAYELGKVLRYRVPRKLSDYGLTAAPQSFVYVRNGFK